MLYLLHRLRQQQIPTGSSYDTDYQNYLDYLSSNTITAPSSGQQDIQNQLILDLKSNGIYSNLNVLYLLANDGSKEAGYVNIINPGTYNITENGTVTWTSNQGVAGNGTSGYLNTGFSPSLITDPTEQEYSIFINTIDSGSGTVRMFFGSKSGTSSSELVYLMNGNEDLTYKVQCGTSTTIAGYDTTYGGLNTIVRSESIASNTQRCYLNGTQINNTTSKALGATNSIPIYILANNNNNSSQDFYSDAEIGIFLAGDADTSLESTKSTLLNGYITSIQA